MKILLTDTILNKDILLPVFSEFKPSELSTHLKFITGDSHEALCDSFSAEPGEIHTLYSKNGKVILLGFGKKKLFGSIYKTARRFSHKNKKQLTEEVTLYLAHELSSNTPTSCEAIINGLITGTYSIGAWKSEDQEAHPLDSEDAVISVFLGKSEIKDFDKLANRAKVVAESQIRMLDLVNTPSNVKTPSYIAQFVTESAEAFGYGVTIFSEDQIWENNLMALAAVNRGSEESAQFVIMEYTPEQSTDTTPTIGLVGKGVTYDSGGLSIKPSDSMAYMKSDMGGAASVIGAFETAVRLKLPVKLIGIIPLTDNLVDSMSIKPGDVINSYSGKTIEVLNTDAEGRLILADGLSYLVRNYKPDHIIDLATLTGATVRTLGYHAAALFCNDDSLSAELESAGLYCGERLWRFPLWEEYADDMKSDVADLKNMSRSPVAGAIFAAKFLEVFIDEHPSWAHLDIAGVSFGDTEFGKDKGGTAYGIRLLTEYLRNLIN